MQKSPLIRQILHGLQTKPCCTDAQGLVGTQFLHLPDCALNSLNIGLFEKLPLAYNLAVSENSQIFKIVLSTFKRAHFVDN